MLARLDCTYSFTGPLRKLEHVDFPLVSVLFPRAAITKYHRRRMLNNRSFLLTVLKMRRLRSRCQQV